MTLLKFLNVFFFQWFFVRLARIVEGPEYKTIGFTLIVGVIPCTGWWSVYKHPPGFPRFVPIFRKKEA